MVATRGKKTTARRNKSLEEKDAAENGLAETQTDVDTQLKYGEKDAAENGLTETQTDGDTQLEDGEKDAAENDLAETQTDGDTQLEDGENDAAENGLTETQTDGDTQLEDGVGLVIDEARNENVGEMPGEEVAKVPEVDDEGPSMPVTKPNGDDIQEDFEENISEDDEIDDQEDVVFEDEEHFEHGEERVLDEDDASEEEASEKDAGDAEVTGEESTEKDEFSEEEPGNEENNREEKENAKQDERKAKAKDGEEATKHGIEKSEATLKSITKSKERTRKKKVQESRLKKADSQDKPKSPRKGKGKKRVESMGMIFICSSETKKDCYQYKVLGLPESKKDIVEKIYTGMRLFLYDIDLRLMYGIYKAAGRGGYNIEPKAFKRQFPSQVRFKVMEDCLPLPEEKFKAVIKENYTSKTRFDLKLNAEQVKKLCRLFAASSKGSPSKKLGKSLKAEKQPVRREKNRRQRTGDKRRLPLREDARNKERPRKRPRKAISPAGVPRQRLPAPLPHQHLPVPLPSTAPSSYAYDRALDADAYRREHRSPPRDRRELPIIPLDPFGGVRDLHTERNECYRDGRDLHLERHYAYRSVQDSRVDRHGPYIDDLDSYSRRRDLDPYRVGRDPYLEPRRLYRDGQDPYIERLESYRDLGRAPYLERRVLSGDSAHSELYSSYRSHPSSDSSNAYREDRVVEIRDPYRQDELLVRRLLVPLDLETRNHHDVPSRDAYLSNREQPSYGERLYPPAYAPQGAVYRL